MSTFYLCITSPSSSWHQRKLTMASVKRYTEVSSGPKALSIFYNTSMISYRLHFLKTVKGFPHSAYWGRGGRLVGITCLHSWSCTTMKKHKPGVLNFISWRAKEVLKYMLGGLWTSLSELFLNISMYSRGDKRAKLHWDRIWPTDRLSRTPAINTIKSPSLCYLLPSHTKENCL